MKCVVLGLVICAAIACAAPAALPQSSSDGAPVAVSRPISEPPPGFHQLSSNEIQALISDRWVSLEQEFDLGVGRRNEEFFCASGIWGGVGARFPLVGRYTTTNDELCVQQSGDMGFCRRVLRDDSGKYFTQRVRSTPLEQTPIEVRVYQQQHEIHCSLQTQ